MEWLTTYSEVRCNNVNDLTRAAQIVAEQIKPPDELYSDLKDALTAKNEIDMGDEERACVTCACLAFCLIQAHAPVYMHFPALGST